MNIIEKVVAKVEDEQFILLLQCFNIRLLQNASTMGKGLYFTLIFNTINALIRLNMLHISDMAHIRGRGNASDTCLFLSFV